jgi:surface protein
MSDFTMESCIEFSQTFESCYSLERVIGTENWDTSKGCTFVEMFNGCSSLKELNWSSFDTRAAYDRYYDMNKSYSNAFNPIFSSVNSLEKLIVSDKISYYGNGNVSEGNKLVFPNPVAKEGYTAKWQNVDTKETYLAKDIPEGVAATYVPCYVYEGQGATMNHALHYLNADPNGTKITTKVSNIIFGRTADYAQIVDTYTGVLADHGQELPVYAYYVPVENGCYDVYILADGTIYAPADCTSLCSGMTNLVSFSTENLDMSRVTTMRRMFSGDGKLQSVDADNWDTSKVTSMNGMFMSCQSLQTLDVSDWDTSEVTDMYAMFYNCKQLPTLDVSDWNVGNVTNMEFTFGGCELFVTLDVADWDVSKVTSFDAFFQSSRKTKGAMKLEYLDVSKWDTSSCVNYDRMFFWCSELKMLDMSSWNSENVKDTGSMFFNCGSLTTLYASEKWSTASLTYSEGMFTGCSKLVGGNGTAFATARVTDGSYAQIDTPETPGYLTYKAAPN